MGGIKNARGSSPTPSSIFAGLLGNCRNLVVKDNRLQVGMGNPSACRRASLLSIYVPRCRAVFSLAECLPRRFPPYVVQYPGARLFSRRAPATPPSYRWLPSTSNSSYVDPGLIFLENLGAGERGRGGSSMALDIYRAEAYTEGTPVTERSQNERTSLESLRRKIHVASLRYPEDAAAVIAVQAPGAVVKINGQIVWREGCETQPAGESYDYAARTMANRNDENVNARLLKLAKPAKANAARSTISCFISCGSYVLAERKVLAQSFWDYRRPVGIASPGNG